MNAKDKANYLVNYYTELLDLGTSNYIKGLAKQCAMKCVNEILKTIVVLKDNDIDFRYWNEVLKEFDKS